MFVSAYFSKNGSLQGHLCTVYTFHLTLFHLFSVLCSGSAVKAENGSIISNTTALLDGSYMYPSSVYVNCNKGTVADGPSTVHCLEDGNWSHTVKCIGK